MEGPAVGDRAAKTTDDHGARRRRVTLTFGDYSGCRSSAHMTVLRREDVQSYDASWDLPSGSHGFAAGPLSRARGSSVAFATRSITDRRQGAKAATQALLRLVGHRDRPARLAVAATGQGVANARRVLIMPGRFHQDAPHQRVAGARDGPRRCFSPLECSPGTSPTYAINARAEPNRRKSCSSPSSSIAARVSMPRKQRSQPTGSRYGSSCAISAWRLSNSRSRAAV